MSKRKKKLKTTKARKEASFLLVWPPEEWPEETRQAETEIIEQGFAEILAELTSSLPPRPPTAQVIPFNRSKK